MLICTLLGAAGNVLLKLGGNQLGSYGVTQILQRPSLILMNFPLMAGYALYGLSTVLLVLALRHGQLSVLYPVISLTYVWVLILSGLIFHETLNFWKIAGVMTVVTGVGVLGRDSRK